MCDGKRERLRGTVYIRSGERGHVGRYMEGHVAGIERIAGSNLREGSGQDVLEGLNWVLSEVEGIR